MPVLVPRLFGHVASDNPFWKQYAKEVADVLQTTSPETRVIFVAHSGAGPLLPALGASCPRPVAGYVFVDAGILFRDASHLDLRADENPEMAREFQAELEQGARFPVWSSDDLREDIPDAEMRENLVQELQPRGHDFFHQTMPVFRFPDAPCAYLQFTAWYESYARQAQARKWPVQKMEGGHFHMLVAPVPVTNALLELTRDMQ